MNTIVSLPLDKSSSQAKDIMSSDSSLPHRFWTTALLLLFTVRVLSADDITGDPRSDANALHAMADSTTSSECGSTSHLTLDKSLDLTVVAM